MSDSQWHYTAGGKQSSAPVSFATLRQLAAGGKLRPTDQVWTDGMAQWAAASTIEGLFAAAPKQKIWHYTTGGKPGPAPVPFATLKQMAAGGQLQPADMVWTDGMAQWAAASTIEGLFAAAPKSASWHYTTNGQPGPAPVPFAALQQMAASGQLQPGDMVWSDGMPNWAAASTVQGLFAASAQPAYMQPFPGGVIGYQSAPIGVQQYAGFGARFAAAFLDGLIVAGINFGVGFAIGFGYVVVSGNRDTGAAQVVATLIGYVLAWLYEAIQESSAAQATIGKRALGIVVTDMSGQRISFGRATGRHFGKYISAIILLIGYIMAAFTEKKQALHDIMAGTLVVKK